MGRGIFLPSFAPLVRRCTIRELSIRLVHGPTFVVAFGAS